MKSRRPPVFVVLLVAYVLCLSAIVWRSSRVIAGERFFSLGDDAMISMRYARNFAEGNGLVWNAGERPVEGYTNLLWVLVMAVVHALPLTVSKTSGVVQALSLSLLAANLFVTRRLAESVGAGLVGSVGAAFLTAFYYPLTESSLWGSELALLVPVLGIAVAVGVRSLAAERFSSTPYWILGAATLVRLDVAVVYVGLLVGLAAIDRARRAAHLTYGIGVLVVFAAAQTAFRFAYYGEWLPNTYYLKMTGYPPLWRIAWGIRGLAVWVWHRNGVMLALAAVGLYWRPRRGAIVAAVAAAQFAYVAYIGPADSRFTTLVMPLVFVLAALGVEALSAAATSVRLPLRRQAPWACAALAAVGAYTLDPDAFRFRRFPTPVLNRDRALDDLTTAHARIAVAAAGTLYFLDRPGVDVLGKNDYLLARAPVHPSFRSFGAGYVSGHMKWNYAYSIDTLAPDVVAEIWRYPEEAAPHLSAYDPIRIGDETIYFRRGSPQIRWDRLPSRLASAAPK